MRTLLKTIFIILIFYFGLNQVLVETQRFSFPVAHGILDPQPRIEPSFGKWLINHWTTGAVLTCELLVVAREI